MMSDFEKPGTCCDFELLLSCSFDGELSSQEEALLAAHLAECDACCARQKHFLKVNTLIESLGRVDEPIQQTRVVVPARKENIESVSRNRWWAFIPLATLAGTAAAIFIWLGGLMPANSGHANGDEIVTTLVSLVEINSERLSDQQMLRNSLEYELRTLRLQIDSLEEHEQESFRGQYEQLFDKILNIETKNE